jgi:hypothetical protein
MHSNDTDAAAYNILNVKETRRPGRPNLETAIRGKLSLQSNATACRVYFSYMENHSHLTNSQERIFEG